MPRTPYTSTPLEELWEKNAPAATALNKNIWNTVWKEGAAEIYVGAQKSAAKMINQPYVFNPKQVMDYYNKHGLELVKTLDNTDKKLFKEILGNNFNASYKDFRDAFGSSFLSSEARFKAIWNTERHNALTHGYDDFVKQQIKNTNIKIEKTWRHSGNPHPREHHIAMEGVTIDYDETFPNGEYLPEGINCGCWLEYREKKGNTNISKIDVEEEYQNNIKFMDLINESNDIRDIQNVFMSRYPDINVNFEGMNLEISKKYLINFDRVLRDIPIPKSEIFTSITSIPATDTYWWRPLGRGPAYAATTPGEIAFNEGFFGKTPSYSIIRSIDRDISCGFHPKDFSMEWISTHEIGHRVFDHIVMTDVPRAKEIFEVVKRAKDSGELMKWGEYAASDPREGIAEIFASIYHTPVQDQPWFVREVAEILTRD